MVHETNGLIPIFHKKLEKALAKPT